MGRCSFSFASIAFFLTKMQASRLLPLSFEMVQRGSDFLGVVQAGVLPHGHMLPRTPDSRLAPSSGSGTGKGVRSLHAWGTDVR